MSIQGQGHSLILAHGQSDKKIKNLFFLETTGPYVNKFHGIAFRNKEMKINKYEFGYMTNMAAMPVYVKIILKIFFSRSNGLTALKLGM